MIKKMSIMTALVGALMFCMIAHAKSPSAREASIARIIPLLEKKIDATMKGQGVPGMAVAIVSRDKVHYLRTFGVKRVGQKDPIMPTTLFQLASLSKPINATLMGVLQEKHKLSLHDDVTHYLPHFTIRNKNQPLKIVHLMSHSTGVPVGGFNEQIEAFAPRAQIVEKLTKRVAIAAPGKHFLYHNAMYGVIEDVVKSATGKPLAVALKEELFVPLGMRNSSVGLDALLNANDKAYPHVKAYRGKYIPAPAYSRGYYAFSAAGGVNASIQDLVPFVQLYLGKPSPIISKNGLQELTSRVVKNPRAVIVNEVKKGTITDTYYGLGWQSMMYANKKIVYHQGHLKGFRHFMGYLQDDVAIVILTNAEKKHASNVAVKFFDLYVKA